MPIRVIVFDYDGTLVFSNEIKRQAFWDIFSAEQVVDQLLRETIDDMPGGSRFDIIRSVLIRLHEGQLSPEDLDAEVMRLAGEYDRIATKGAATCRERPGVTRMLTALEKSYSLHLLSATWEPSLLHIIDQRNWSKFFKSIRGFPCDKADELAVIARQEGVLMPEILMVGDSAIDQDAAERAGTHFLLVDEQTSPQSITDCVSALP